MMLAEAEAIAARAQPRGKSCKGGKAKLNNNTAYATVKSYS